LVGDLEESAKQAAIAAMRTAAERAALHGKTDVPFVVLRIHEFRCC
jgi:hypothetical protein